MPLMSPSGDRKQRPLSWHALELVDSAVFKPQAGADNQILDRPRYEDLPGRGIGYNTGTDVEGNAAKLLARALALARMNACGYADADAFYRLRYGLCTSHGARRAVKRRQKPVPGGVDLTASEAPQLLPHQMMVVAQKILPIAIPNLGCSRSCADNIGEHDGRKHALGVGTASDAS